MTKKDQETPESFSQQESAFNENSEQWWSQGKVESRIPGKKSFFLNKFGIAAIISVLVLIFVLISLSARNNNGDSIPFQMNIIKTEETQEATVLQEQIIQLRQQLNEADPTIKHLPFPNVDMGLTMDSIDN